MLNEEKIRAHKAKGRVEDVVDSILEKAEWVSGLLPAEKKFWESLAGFLDGIAEICASLEQDIPVPSGGGQKIRLPRIPHVPKKIEHSLWC